MPKPRKGKGKSTYNAPLGDDAEARIWVLTEEGLSQRAVAEQLGVAASTVGAALAKDPVRLESLRARLAEERASRYREMEQKGQLACLLWLDESIKLGERVAKRGLSAIGAKQLDKVAILPRLIQVGSQTAERSTKASNLLTGKATERVENTTKEMDADQLIDAAIEHGLVDRLPPALQDEAKKRTKAKP